MNRTIVIARFENSDEASDGRDALESIFDEVSEQVADLYKRQNGFADIADIEKIYAKHGLRNDNGWEPEMPILTNGNDLAWALPTGAYVEDAENLLLTMGATNVAIHEQIETAEDWRNAPHPMIMPLNSDMLDEDELFFFDDEERVAQVFSRKRTIH